MLPAGETVSFWEQLRLFPKVGAELGCKGGVRTPGRPVGCPWDMEAACLLSNITAAGELLTFPNPPRLC